MEELDQSVRDAEQQRQRLEQAVSEAQRALDGQRLERQELLVRRRTLEEQLAERDCTAPASELKTPATPAATLAEGLVTESTKLIAMSAIPFTT